MKIIKEIIIKIVSIDKVKVILYLFVLSQFMFFGWALGQFVEPEKLPIFYDDEFTKLDSGNLSQFKEGMLKIGSNISFYSTTTGGLIKFNDISNDFYIKSAIGNGMIFKTGSTEIRLFYDQDKNGLVLKSSNPIYLGGDRVIMKVEDSGYNSYPEYGSLCGYSRIVPGRGIGSGGVYPKCKDLIPCKGINLCEYNKCPRNYNFVKIIGEGHILTCYFNGQW
jgi:hypothetical protein